MKKILLGIIALGMIVVTGCQNSLTSYRPNSSSPKGKYVICDGSKFSWKDVTNPTTGKTWMDRNLGARQVATNSTDSLAYGDLYQWGRGADGHQCRNSDTTSSLSNGDNPGHGDFITKSSSPYDWRSLQNDSLWQGVDGINNPCPTGYRLPTKTEWEEEVKTWTSRSADGAYGSVLKLSKAGYHNNGSGSLDAIGTYGVYWSSTVRGKYAEPLFFDSREAYVPTNFRANGLSVRCIKD